MKKLLLLAFAAVVLAGCSKAAVPIGKDTVVTMNYTGKLKDGKVFDSSAQHGQPFTFIDGEGKIIPGLEKGLAGLVAGDKKTIVVPADEAYPYNKNLVITVSRDKLPTTMTVKVGGEVATQTPNGPLAGQITKVEGKQVTIDFNPPIAGKELIFDVHILGVRKATPEEIAGKVPPKPVITVKQPAPAKQPALSKQPASSKTPAPAK